jgi:RNA polymerase sigma-70 factor, ECF subfamily
VKPFVPGAVLGLAEEPRKGQGGERAALSDAEAARLACTGDEEAFRMLFERHAPAVRRFAGNVLRDPADAEEATQETFVRAHARLRHLKDEARVRGWLLGIARIVALDMFAERRGNGRSAVPEAAPGEVIDLDRTPENTLLDAEAERMLFDELSRLSPERRAALVLRLDQHLGYGEIAGVMGWTLQKVKNEIHRARLQMRERLLRYLRGGP